MRRSPCPPPILAAALLAALAAAALPAAARAANPVVRFAVKLGDGTPYGTLDVELCDEVSTLCLGAAPETVANFLGYVDRGDYVDSIIHRSAKKKASDGSTVPFVIQGGGFYLDTVASLIRVVPQQLPVVNQYNQSNVRGTLAMARTQAVNSATNQWFVNLSDNGLTAGETCLTNPGSLDCYNGGFTVFGVVTGSGMDVADAIAMQPIGQLYQTLQDVPDFWSPIYANPACNQTSCVRANFGQTPLGPGVPVSFATPQEVLPYLFLVDVTRVPEPAAGSAGAAALAAVGALARRRRRAR